MIELPRITRALRAHTQLDKPRCLKPKVDPTKPLQLKKKNLQRFKSYTDIYNYVKQNEPDSADILKLFPQLKEACKLLTGDQSDEIIEDAAVLTLRMFLDQDIVMLKHMSQLRQTFGTVLSATANKICEIVTKISEQLSDNTKDYIRTEEAESNKENIKLWGDHIQCHYIPYKPVKKPLAKLTSKPATASAFVTDFSMKYDSDRAAKATAGPSKVTAPIPESKYGKTWLETKVKEQYENVAEISSVDILQSIITLLNSPRTNDEMQNDLFELLGFDKFEFIQEILEHRQDIINSLKAPPAGPTLSEIAALLPENKMPQYLCQVSVLSEQEKMLAKLVRKEEKKAKNRRVEDDDDEEQEINISQMRAKRLAELSKPVVPFSTSSRSSNVDPILQKISYFQTKVQYPNVYDSSINAKNSAGFVSGLKLILPENAVRKDTKEFEEVTIPKNDPPPLTVGNQRVPIAELDEIGQMAFENIKELNRIQSVVFQTAYNTNENLLICAPTGAGKTNIALLTVVHQIKQHIENNVIMKNKFKIIYIAPMKALASEMTASFGRRLKGLGISVRELTGDMKLTKTEVQQTQMIVTTPEKWDVVTRKGATDTELASIVKLLIIDEVHLLHGDRGPIVEAIVARTLRQVESTQNMIRIVGLSATLPNYVDVARFLRVNPNIGLFYFDSRFRPVPLEQQFIGVKETGSGGGAHLRTMQTMNEICYDKAVEMVQKGHQVMVFVHARNATHQTAMILKEIAQKKGHLKHFEPEDSGAFLKAKKSISSSPNKQLGELFASGFACHHAGMLRSDRNMVEKYFAEGFIKVLVCTSTLAWGVNLPAHAVIIRGTEIYDQSHGTFVDLSILDVLQIFGRAGRPQFDTSGTGIIITTHDKLTHYLKSMTNQFPIESNFINLLADNLNAEVALGTVTNIDEAVEWLSYTYLFVRMRINPQVRKEELTELWNLKDQYCELRIEDAPEDIHWKINILLQTYLSRGRVNGSSLQSDLNYISQVVTNEPQELIITIPISEPLPPQYYIRATSERWLGSESVLPLTFQHLILPETHPPHTDLLELQPLPVTALNNPNYEMLYNFSHFNPIQTQIFHCLYHTDHNVLLGAPTGSGKTIVAEVVYIAPLKALVKERIKDWKVRLQERLGKQVVELTVIDEIHLLGEDRGPVLEVIVSRTNFIESHTSRRLRIIGLSTALANAKDLANWLNIGEMGLYNFRPSVRPVPLEVHISGHPGRHYCPRMMTMNKPTFQAIRTHSPCAPALVFVSSRRQTRLTALDLIAYLAAEDNPKQWLHMQESEMEQILANIRESNLKLTLAFGIGIHHAGLHERDRTTVEELFINQKIQVLICTATLAWGVNFPAHLVVIKGTEYYDGKQKRYVDMPITDVLQMMGRAGRPQYDNEGVAVVLVHDQKKNFYKKFLYEPFPVESSLLEVLPDHLNAEIVAGTVQTKQDILDYLTWTYFFRRLLKNPSYYNLESVEPQDVNYYLSNLVQSSLDALANANCLEIEEAFLLLQAHMTRLVLPNTDYLTDTKSVLDQTIRILQAMIDTSAENGWLSVCLSCQMLMQGIVQARWPTESPLLTLPHIDSQHLYIFSKMANDTHKPCNMLNGLKVAICDMPTLDVKLSVRGLWFDGEGEQDKLEYTLLIDLNRRGGNPNTVLCPRFPRGKNEGWILTLGTVDDGELHALKRVPPKGTTQVTFYTPSRKGRIIYTLFVLSDSYMGLDQQYDLQIELIDPLPSENIDRVYNIDKTIIE
ncbi:hypothetical protein HF086_004267 [Spodoptera exigua]|uniref:U5 small nuclear ribonucleoprotein 200 kDa helicase n=1 Tax=Spodoptera exigua TaxID=7107 RepID=A0A922MWC9_SPOEX|nr:hypothetical protein HF086_004267 [Spodoptera exigua]